LEMVGAKLSRERKDVDEVYMKLAKEEKGR
jgi:hypothetical protein